MRIDNSQWKLWMECPYQWYERYHRLNLDGSRGRQRQRLNPGGMEFGTRMHQLIAWRNSMNFETPRVPSLPQFRELEEEAQVIFAYYGAAYPQESFEVLDVERTIEVPLGPHTYVFKCDLWGRKADGRYFIQDHKTEKRGSKANSPQAWTAKTQASLYLWGAERYYGIRPDHLEVDIITRRSPKGEIGPSFRRYQAERTDQQRTEAAIALQRWADLITDVIEENDQFINDHLSWSELHNPNACVNELTGWKCDFYEPHVLGDSPEHDRLYQIAEAYLDT